jgi:lipid-binding SYLF domain-containing protein
VGSTVLTICGALVDECFYACLLFYSVFFCLQWHFETHSFSVVVFFLLQSLYYSGVRIPARLLEQARGIAVLTVVKGGFGVAGCELGTGLVVARLDDHRWSAPSAIGTAGISWGALVGAQVSDHVFLLMTDAAVQLFFQQGSVQLGADVGVALGPLGRAVEADVSAAHGGVASIYTYSLSKGLYAGISLDGKVVLTRDRVNEKFYGRVVSGSEILQGGVPTPPAAQPLYEALTRCHVYASSSSSNTTPFRTSTTNPWSVPPSFSNSSYANEGAPTTPQDRLVMGEYGEIAGGGEGGMPFSYLPAAVTNPDYQEPHYNYS